MPPPRLKMVEWHYFADLRDSLPPHRQQLIKGGIAGYGWLCRRPSSNPFPDAGSEKWIRLYIHNAGWRVLWNWLRT